MENEFLKETKQTKYSKGIYNTPLIDEKRYHKTLLLACFLGVFGAHRIVNKRSISGMIMLVLGIVSIFSYVIIPKFLDYFSSTPIFGLLFIIFGIAFVLIWVLSLRNLLDIIMIMFGRFRVNKSMQYLTSGRTFIKTWSNIIGLLVIVGTLMIFVKNSTVLTLYLLDKEYISSDEVLVEEVDLNKEIVSCIQEGKEITPSNSISFKHLLEEKLRDNGYIVFDNGEGVTGTKEMETLGDSMSIIVNDVNDDGVYECTLQIIDNAHNDRLEYVLSIYNSEVGANVIEFYAFSMDYEGSSDDRYVVGYYYVEAEMFDLYYWDGMDRNYESGPTYDLKTDEWQLSDKLTDGIKIYMDELDSLSR